MTMRSCVWQSNHFHYSGHADRCGPTILMIGCGRYAGHKKKNRRRIFSMMKFLQKLGKALMLPVAVLPICGILMGIGYWLCPATMQGGEIQGVANLIGLFLVKAGGALIDNMAILFAIGVGVGMSEKNDGTGAIAALASWLML